MIKIFTWIIILIGITIRLNAQTSTRDTTIISIEYEIESYLSRLTRELTLTEKQQKEVYKILSKKTKEKKNSKEPLLLDANSTEFLNNLGYLQKKQFLYLLDIDNKADKNIKRTLSSLKSTTASTASNTLVLNDPSKFIDARLCYNENPSYTYSNDYVYNTYPRDNAVAWTNGGYLMKYRTVIKFILSDIPIGSEITSATLYFYSDPTETSSSSANGNSQLSGSNAFYIERITQNWSDQTVTWNNQPATTTENRLLIPASASTTENIQIDLSNMVQTWVNNPSLNFGMKMFLQTESYYRSRNYGSMEHPNTMIRPKLVVEYNSISSTIEYIYDAAGNREIRQVIVLPSQAYVKSAVIEPENQEPITTHWDNTNINIYPNPTIGELRLNVKGNLEETLIDYKLINTTGKTLLRGKVNVSETTTIPVSKVPSGIYILVLSQKQNVKTIKIIKQ